MRSELKEFLIASERVVRPPAAATRECKICRDYARYLGTVDFSKNCANAQIPAFGASVTYYCCPTCDFTFTDFCDDWTPEDFSELIYNDRYIVVDPEYDGSRGKQTAQAMLPILEQVGKHISVLDFGAGNGSFADVLRDAGFARVANYDPYAGGERADGVFDLVTAFEVVEHSATPIETFDTLVSHMADGGCIYVGQSMLPINIGDLGVNWWYIAPRNGHISFYSFRTMAKYAEMRGLIYRNSGDAFILHRPKVSKATRQFLKHHQARPVMEIIERLSVREGSPGWHASELSEKGRFRWTSSRETHLGEMSFQPTGTFLSLPVKMTIADHFWTDSSLRIGDSLVPLKRRGDSLCAVIQPSQEIRSDVFLVTPEPVRPSDRGSSTDHRPLGVAILVA